MNRRDFWKRTAAGLIVAAAPRIALSEEYTHVADMYDWDGVYRTREEMRKAPFAQPGGEKPKTVLRKEIELEKIMRAKNLFQDPEKIKDVFKITLDEKLPNDELSAIIIGKEKGSVAFRFITPDNNFAPLVSRNSEEVERFGDIHYYVTSENMCTEKVVQLAQYLNINLT